MEQETGSHSGEGPEESLIVRCSDAVLAGGWGGRGGGNASTERAPHAPQITTHLAVLQGAALGWEFIDLCTLSVDSNLQEL